MKIILKTGLAAALALAAATGTVARADGGDEWISVNLDAGGGQFLIRVRNPDTQAYEDEWVAVLEGGGEIGPSMGDGNLYLNASDPEIPCFPYDFWKFAGWSLNGKTYHDGGRVRDGEVSAGQTLCAEWDGPESLWGLGLSWESIGELFLDPWYSFTTGTTGRSLGWDVDEQEWTVVAEADDGDAWLETTMTGPGTVSFDWMGGFGDGQEVEEYNEDTDEWESWWEPSGQAVFAIDGAVKASLGDNEAWKHKTINVPAGVHTLRWTCSDWGGDSGASLWLRSLECESAVIQKVRFSPAGGLPLEVGEYEIGNFYGELPPPVKKRAKLVAHDWQVEEIPFLGWYTAWSGGERVTATNVVTGEGRRTLYARWATVQTVTFNPNGGTCATATKSVPIGGTYGTLPVPKRQGYTYKGWWTAKTGGKRVFSGSEVTEAATRTLYARWELTSQKVTFDPNGGTCAVASTNVPVDGTYGSLPVPKRGGHTYKGWWTAKTGGKRVYFGSAVTQKPTRTLYARWEAGEQTVTFNANGGTCAVASTNVQVGGTYGTLPVPKRQGYAYKGWWTAKKDGKRVYSGTTVSDAWSRTLYARWELTTQKVIFDSNGGTCAVASTNVAVGGTYGTLPVPKRGGYTYKGWWTAAEGGKRVYSGSAVTAAAARTLYAHWEAAKSANARGDGSEDESPRRSAFFRWLRQEK